MAFLSGNSPESSLEQRRKMGGNEIFANFCHNAGNLNVMTGLTLLTRHAIDTGLLKCALQEFQHTYPQLTSRILGCQPPGHSQNLQFAPMECPTLPLDSNFNCRDMLHQKFDTSSGPLWRVQLVTEASMDSPNLRFGPELQAILEGDDLQATRWRYFLRYLQGKVNQTDILPYDELEEGYRCFILMTFHPSVTDQIGAFHLMRQFLLILDSILEVEHGNRSKGLFKSEEFNLHQPVEALLPPKESTFQMRDIGKFVRDYIAPYRSPLESVQSIPEANGTTDHGQTHQTQMLRGWLDEEETRELMAMLEEDDCSLHGVIAAAGLLAVARILQDANLVSPDESVSLRAMHEMNLRQYCLSASQKTLGAYTTFHEADHRVPVVTEKEDFWKFAHELTVKHNAAKGTKDPLQMLRTYNGTLYMGGENAVKDMEKNSRIRAEMTVSVYGDLGHLMRRNHENGISTSVFQSIDTWNRPLSTTRSNIRLEDVLHAVAAPHMGSPFSHSAHILHDRLNYFLTYQTSYVREQRLAFNVRDEAMLILRMAAKKSD